MNIPTINLARTGTNIVMLRKAAGLTVHDLHANPEKKFFPVF